MTFLPGYSLLTKVSENTSSRIYNGIRTADYLAVTIKLLVRENPSITEIARLKNEYSILESLNGKGTLKVYAFEEYKNNFAAIFERFYGQTLEELLEVSNFSLLDILDIAVNLVEILGDLQTENIIHKNINPSSILMHPASGELKIIDFDIASRISYESPLLVTEPPRGSLSYISPEQTGRMNRNLDYRTDFYSLGVTLYKLLCKRLPFESDEPLELVHAHIAKVPFRPCEIDPDIPQVLSDIIMKLVAKNAEDRYQSTVGIKSDLIKCQEELKKLGSIAPFELGEQDVSQKLNIFQKLYGRDKEIWTLKDHFRKAARGSCESVVIQGPSGVGKTSLVMEVCKPLAAQGALFISGKFDQFQSNAPYKAFIKAFQDLIRQILTQSDSSLEKWKQKILSVLGANTRLIIDVIPDLELITGPVEPVEELGPLEAQNRFNLTFRDFTRLFCGPEQVLIIFLDDLQWIDSGSLKLMEQIVTDSNMQYLLLIGGYRDNELEEDHPLFKLFAELKFKCKGLDSILIPPLEQEYVLEMIADSLKADQEQTASLADLVSSVTRGNPLYIVIFLKSLHAKGFIKFSACRHKWEFDLQSINEFGFPDYILELMVERIQLLSAETQQVLQTASCIGDRFGLRPLAEVCSKSQREVLEILKDAIAADLVIADSDKYKVIEQGVSLSSLSMEVEFSFTHDRIHQAVYSLLSPTDQHKTHYEVGKYLLENSPNQDEDIFDIVNHLNIGLGFKGDQAKQNQLVVLNLEAGKKAKASTAYIQSFKYLKTAMDLLQKDSWENKYDTTLEIYLHTAEAAYLCCNYEQAHKYIAIVLQRANNLQHKVRGYEIKIEAYKSQYKFIKALNTAHEVLKLINVTLPRNPGRTSFKINLAKTMYSLKEIEDEDLVDLTEMQDPFKLAAMRIMMNMSSAAYFAHPALFPILVFKMVRFSVRHGNAQESGFVYALYGLILCGLLGKIDTGYKFGSIALKVQESLAVNKFNAKTLTMVNGFVRHWKSDLKLSITPMANALKKALEAGDMEYAGYAAFLETYHLFVSGKSLTAVEARMKKNRPVFESRQYEASWHMLEIYRQTVSFLSGEPGYKSVLKGRYYNELQMLAVHKKANDGTTLFNLFFCKLYLDYMFGNYQNAIENSVQAERYIRAVPGSYAVPLYYFYDSLARLAIFKDSDGHEQKRITSRVGANQKKIKKWSSYAPMNNGHKYLLVEAERLRVGNKLAKAREYYDQCISLANKYGYLNEESLANELAAKFYLEIGNKKIHRVYIEDSRYCYKQWGALAKVKQLESLYKLFDNPSEMEESKLETNTTEWTNNKGLDVTSALKVSQAISSEIMLSSLLHKLMNIVIENAGAQKGFLIIRSGKDLLIEAEVNVQNNKIQVLQSIPLDECKDLSKEVVNYVLRTEEHRVINDALNDEQFMNSTYVKESSPRSIICVPVMHKNHLVGLLYLENNLITGAFTSDRIEMLNLINSQIGISLENARLYSNLEEQAKEIKEMNLELENRVRERTAELSSSLSKLQETQAKLVQSEKMASLGELVSGIAHEINTPLGIINSNTDLINRYVQKGNSLDEQEIDKLELINTIGRKLQTTMSACESILTIVNSLRVFARLDEAEYQSATLDSLLENTLAIMRGKLKKGIKVNTKYHYKQPVSCFPSQMNQVFINLINNAYDAMQGEGELDISVYSRDNNIVLVFRDTGPGLAENVQTKIFDPGYTTKGVGVGTGLGLSICYRIIVEKHGGRIWGENRLKKGAKFTIELPLKDKKELLQ